MGQLDLTLLCSTNDDDDNATQAKMAPEAVNTQQDASNDVNVQLAADLQALKTAVAEPAAADAAADDSGDESDGDADPSTSNAAEGGKKKKNKKKKSGAAKKRAAKAKLAAPAMQQTEPPTVGLRKIYTNGVFPVGQIDVYGDEFYNE